MDLRLAELLASLSIATDLGSGHEPEKAVRACLIATEVARAMDLSDAEVADVYYTTLLRHLGCTGTSHEEAYLFGGDELASRPPGERADFGNAREMFALLLSTGRGTGAMRLRYLARAIRDGSKGTDRILGALCEVAVQLAGRLGMGAGVRAGLGEVFERWDGKGTPGRLSGDDVAIGARLAEIGHQAVIFDRLGGPEAVVEVARRRSGGWFDPVAAEALIRIGPDLLTRLSGEDVWASVLDAEPDPKRLVPADALDDIARTFADFADLKTPFTLGHSSAVADLAERAGAALGVTADEIVPLRRAAHLHDLGRVAVSNGVWEKPGPLATSEWEQVRLHPYQTQRILSHATALEPLGRLAGRHHERQDGSGYPAAVAGSELSMPARLIAAADAYQAMTQDRPHRPARSDEAAAEELGREAAAGRLDPEAVRAVVEAAGGRVPRRGAWPAGLSDREVEVLRLVARGLSNKEIAGELFISRKTAEHHVHHAYAKIGISTRAGAAVFAMEHGLVR